MTLALTDHGERLLGLYPEDLRPELRGALEEILRDALALAAEVREAEAAGVAFADAVQRFPMMGRVHAGAIELLQTDLAPDEQNALLHILAAAAGPEADALRRMWFLLAAEGDGVGGPLMRFLLFQAVRLNVWVLTWNGGAPLEATGALRELDERAEVMLRARLAMDAMHDPSVRPLQVLVAEALAELAAIWEHRRRDLAEANRDRAELLHGLARAARVARNLGAGDAALIRNEIDGATGGEQLGSAELTSRSPSLVSQNATDQRRRRLLARLEADPDPAPSGDRLIDLLID